MYGTTHDHSGHHVTYDRYTNSDVNEHHSMRHTHVVETYS